MKYFKWVLMVIGFNFISLEASNINVLDIKKETFMIGKWLYVKDTCYPKSQDCEDNHFSEDFYKAEGSLKVNITFDCLICNDQKQSYYTKDLSGQSYNSNKPLKFSYERLFMSPETFINPPEHYILNKKENVMYVNRILVYNNMQSIQILYFELINENKILMNGRYILERVK